jgi:PBP1b-binding outer membrane lipoprotein LpoB
MKRVASIIAVMFLCFAFAGCGRNNQSHEAVQNKTTKNTEADQVPPAIDERQSVEPLLRSSRQGDPPAPRGSR